MWTEKSFCFIFCLGFLPLFFAHYLNCSCASLNIISWTTVFAFPKLKSDWDDSAVMDSWQANDSSTNSLLGGICQSDLLLLFFHKCLQTAFSLPTPCKRRPTAIDCHDLIDIFMDQREDIWTISPCCFVDSWQLLCIFSACEDPAGAGAGGTGAGPDTVPGPVFHQQARTWRDHPKWGHGQTETGQTWIELIH